MKEMNNWFKGLDSLTMAFIFPGLYHEIMESADPSVNINTFVKEAKEKWNNLPKEEKSKLYAQYKDA